MLTASSKSLQTFLKRVMNKVEKLDIVQRHGLVRNSPILPHKFWLIKDPILRHIRLKIAWKDVLSLERCFRFRMTDSSACTICGREETVAHQLWDCQNARRIWQYTCDFAGISTDQLALNLGDLIDYRADSIIELIKSQSFRFLIQIDRSAHLTYDRFVTKMKMILGIEYEVLLKQGNTTLIKRIESYLK